MFKKIDHIGIAVKDLDESNAVYSKLLGLSPYMIEFVDNQSVRVSFFKHKHSKIELLEPSSEKSPIYKFLEKRGEGMHHMAFLVDDIHAEMKRLHNEGFRLLQSEPVNGADNKLVCFIEPKDCSGVLIEICQKIKDSD